MSRLDAEGLDGVLEETNAKHMPAETAAVASSRLGVAQVELIGDLEDEVPFGFEIAEPATFVTPVYEDDHEIPTDPHIGLSGPRIVTTPLPNLEMELPDPVDLDDEGPNVARRVFLLAIATVLLAGICTWAFQTFSGLVRPEVAEVAPPVFPLGVSPPGLSQPETDVALPEFDPGADASVAALMISPEAQALQAELEAAAALRAAAVMVEELEAASEAERLADAETNRMLAEQEAAAIADAEEAQLEALRLADLASQDVEQAERVAESQAAAALAARITATEEAAAARRLRASARQAETARRDTPAPTIQPEVTTEPSATIGTPVVTTRTTTTAPAPTGENMSAGSSSDTYGLRTPISAIPDTLPAPSSVQSPGPNSYSAQFPAAFTYNNNAMSVSNEAQAMAIINAIIASPGPVRVVGHTDSSGSATMNLRLGWLRANTVRKYLIRSGVEDSRITVESAGPSQPITTNETREGRELNRRVMLIYPRAQR